MNQEQKELLKNANIPEDWWDNCYISDKGQIFTPLKDGEGNIIKTGEQVYNEDYLNPPTPTPTTEELLLKEIANLKVEIMTMKGVN